MVFSEETLNLGITYGTTTTITTSTAIVESFLGLETRSINWVQPLLKFNIGQRGSLNQELEQFIAFHQARKGAYQGFRFKDWSDYEFNQVITLNTNKQAQLFKTYTVEGLSVKRPLIKIVTGTVSVFVNNILVAQGWTLNYNTGVITFDQIPAGTIRVLGEFDVPVRFENDKIDLRFEAYEPGTGDKIFNWEGLSLSEVRINPNLPLSFDPISQNLNHLINLGYNYGTVGGNKFATRIERMVSGHELRTSEWPDSQGSWEIGSRSLLKSELEYLISLFRVCRGKAIEFRYFDWAVENQVSVRFGEDAIAFRFDAFEKETGEVIFNLAGVPLVSVFNESPPPCANAFVLDFEGLFDNEQVLNFYDGGYGGSELNFGVSFGDGAQAFISVDAEGTGNFINQPSGITAAFFLSSSGTNFLMNVTAGFTGGFSFFYSANATNPPTPVRIYDGLNGTGNLLAEILLPNNAFDGCNPGVDGTFCNWDPIGVSFSGVAKSVDFSAVANYIAFDNITIGCDTPILN